MTKPNGVELCVVTLVGLVMGCAQTGAWTARDEPEDSVFAYARDDFSEKPVYVPGPQFQPPQQAADADKPVIPDSPKRAIDPTEALAVPRAERDDEAREVPASEKGEAEVLAFLIAIDQGEIKTAANAAKEKMDPQVQRHASRLHQDHDRNLQKTMQLAEQIGVTPLQTAEVEKFINNHHAKLAKLIQRDGEEFAEAYLDQMVKEHTKVLSMIDEKFLPKAQNAELKQHLKTTRQAVASHLEEAKRLQNSGVQR